MRRIQIRHANAAAIKACFAGEKVARPRKSGVVCANCSKWAKAKVNA